MLDQLIAIAVGGAVGALFRFWLSTGVYALLGRGFPYGTLSVNVLGSFLVGFLFVILLERMQVGAYWRAGVLIGILGAFTTFSTFSIETLNLIEDGTFIKAALNVVFSVVLSLGGTWFGVVLGRGL
ncbi:MAG: fluoride efflux transporter CrcB [Gammaproteobacteria bacterium]|nr:MAG: fluoride efflux transporter CrcB [Gammaproteobacteria bacterium]